jgi:uncharacterized damage-inducible protein DinB
VADPIRRILEPAAGTRSRLVGLFLWQLDDQSRRLTEDTRGVTPEELAWQSAPGMNTIGMLLAHIALVEVGWINRGVLGREWDEEGVLSVRFPDGGMPMHPEAAPPAALAGRDLAWFDDLLAGARTHTRNAVASLTDEDIGRTRKLRRSTGDELEIDVGWTLYHILEHEAGHYGQINLLRHLYRLHTLGLAPPTVRG